MKERYVKPAILFEDFSLTQTIARNCGDDHHGSLGESNHYNEETCNWIFGDYVLFFKAVCKHGDFLDIEEGEDFEFENLCYNNPEGGQQVFSST